MGNIINFFKRNKENEDITLQAGGKLEILGRVKDMGVLINDFAFPVKKEDLTEDMVNYQKRYQLTMAIDQMMKRVQDDPQLNGAKIGLLLEPQQLVEKNGNNVLRTQIELVLPMVVDLKSDATIQVNSAEEAVMKDID